MKRSHAHQPCSQTLRFKSCEYSVHFSSRVSGRRISISRGFLWFCSEVFSWNPSDLSPMLRLLNLPLMFSKEVFGKTRCGFFGPKLPYFPHLHFSIQIWSLLRRGPHQVHWPFAFPCHSRGPEGLNPCLGPLPRWHHASLPRDGATRGLARSYSPPANPLSYLSTRALLGVTRHKP